MVRYSRVPPGRRARLRSPSRQGPLLGNLGQPVAPLTAPVIRDGFWHRLRGRGPFTVIPLGQLPEEQRSLLVQALCEEIGCQIAMSVASSVNQNQMEATENNEGNPQSLQTDSATCNYLNTQHGRGIVGKTQLDAKPGTIYESLMMDWKFLACLVLIVVVACAIGYIFRKELYNIQSMRLTNNINEKKGDNLYCSQVI